MRHGRGLALRAPEHQQGELVQLGVEVGVPAVDDPRSPRGDAITVHRLVARQEVLEPRARVGNQSPLDLDVDGALGRAVGVAAHTEAQGRGPIDGVGLDVHGHVQPEGVIEREVAGRQLEVLHLARDEDLLGLPDAVPGDAGGAGGPGESEAVLLGDQVLADGAPLEEDLRALGRRVHQLGPERGRLRPAHGPDLGPLQQPVGGHGWRLVEGHHPEDGRGWDAGTLFGAAGSQERGQDRAQRDRPTREQRPPHGRPTLSRCPPRRHEERGLDVPFEGRYCRALFEGARSCGDIWSSELWSRSRCPLKRRA